MSEEKLDRKAQKNSRQQEMEALGEKLLLDLKIDLDTKLVTLPSGREVPFHVNAHGYYRFFYKGRHWLVHRVLWFQSFRYWPKLIDHINGDRLDNRIENLREVTPQQNSLNCTQKSNSSPYRGVSARDGVFRAAITLDGKKRHLGTFETAEEAAEAYNAAVLAVDPKARVNEIPIKPQGDEEVNKTIANLTRNMALQSKLYKDLQSERDMLLAEVGELRRQAARAQQSEVEKLQKMLADCIEGFEGHFGPAFWESPLGKRIRAFEAKGEK